MEMKIQSQHYRCQMKLNGRTREEKDTSKMNLEKRTLFASLKKVASESLHYPESEKLRSEDKATSEMEQSECCTKAAKAVTAGHFTMMWLWKRIRNGNLSMLARSTDEQQGFAGQVLQHLCAFVQVYRTTRNFKNSNEIKAVDLDVSSAWVHLTHRTEPFNLKIGETMVKKTLYRIYMD